MGTTTEVVVGADWIKFTDKEGRPLLILSAEEAYQALRTVKE